MKLFHVKSASLSFVSYSRLVFVGEAPAAAAAPTEAEKAAEAKAAVQGKARFELNKARMDLFKEPAREATDDPNALLKTATEKVGKMENMPFTKDTATAFFTNILTKTREALKGETDSKKKEKMEYLYYDSASRDFCDKFMAQYYFIFADGVPGDIELSATVENGKITEIKAKDPANQTKIDNAKKFVDDKAKEAAGNPEVAAEMARFQTEHPEAFGFLQTMVFNGPTGEADMKKAFEGGGPMGIILGIIGFGGGKKTYGSFMKNKNFAKFADSALDALAKLSPSMDFRRPVELEKDSDLKEFYDNLPSDGFKTVGKKFEVKKEITLPAVTTFDSIVFPKGKDEKIDIKGSKNGGSPFGDLSLKREERQEKITVPAGTKLEPGTVFANITIGDKTAIDRANSGTGPTAPAAAAKEAAPAVASKPAEPPKVAASGTPAAAPAVAPAEEKK